MAEKQHTQTRPKDRGFPRISSEPRLTRSVQSFSRYSRVLRFTGQPHRPHPDISLAAGATG